MRPLIAVIAVAALAVIAAMASVARSGPIALPLLPTPTPRVWEWPSAEPTEAPARAHPQLLSGFIVPVGGTQVPMEEQYLPNSPRDYRAGYHEGIDFPVRAGTPVLAAKAGTIARIDSAFTDWTVEQEQAAFDAAQALGYTPAATLDRIRGRQVGIDHGGGIVSPEAHPSAASPRRAGAAPGPGEARGAARRTAPT